MNADPCSKCRTLRHGAITREDISGLSALFLLIFLATHSSVLRFIYINDTLKKI